MHIIDFFTQNNIKKTKMCFTSYHYKTTTVPMMFLIPLKNYQETVQIHTHTHTVSKEPEFRFSLFLFIYLYFIKCSINLDRFAIDISILICKCPESNFSLYFILITFLSFFKYNSIHASKFNAAAPHHLLMHNITNLKVSGYEFMLNTEDRQDDER